MAGEFSLRDLVRALNGATVEAKREIAGLVREAATATAEAVRHAYPLGPTGNLRRMIQARAGTKRGTFDASAGVNLTWYARAYAPHVHFIESGTKLRRDPTRGNANRGRVTPRGPIFVPIAVRERTHLLAQARALLDRPKEL